MNLFPLDLPRAIHNALSESHRANDGLLHCSGDLVGSLRHVMLSAAGAPQKKNDLVSDIVLETGTMWHKRLGELLVSAGVPFMQEVRMTPWLPKGWGGTADWIFWHPEYEAFVLGDLKTTVGEGLPHIEREGIKREHHHQLSAYWYAARNMGLPLVKGFGVLYLPKNRAKNYKTEPILIEAEPLDETYLLDLMHDRVERVNEYLHDLSHVAHNQLGNEKYIVDSLAEPIERELKLVWASDHYDVKLMPHWTTQFCPYDDDLCDCNTQGETKVGMYSYAYDVNVGDTAEYTPRKGYEDISPPVLTNTHLRRLGVSSK